MNELMFDSICLGALFFGIGFYLLDTLTYEWPEQKVLFYIIGTCSVLFGIFFYFFFPYIGIL